MTDQTRQLLIDLITGYLNRPHIQMKGPMKYYLHLLENGMSLKPRHLQTIVPYLRFDMKMEDHDINSFFSPLTDQRPIKRTLTNQSISTLEPFL